MESSASNFQGEGVVYEDCSLPIIYCDKQELKDFAAGNAADCDGVAYEWEGEGVVHLRMTAAEHGYGKVARCLFTADESVLRQGGAELARYSYVLLVARDGESAAAYAVSETENGCSLQKKELQYIPAKAELYSRSKGLLEVDALEKKRVMIVGLGSFGSQIAIELAKAGVGEFSLLDFDRVELHNLARHTCTVNDLGRLKTDAIYDAIRGKNPYARVDRFPVDINKNPELLEAEVARADLVICATDNNQSRFHLSNALLRQQKVCIFGRAVTRAEGGDVFRYRPGGPCYNCLIGNSWFDSHAEEITNVASARRNGQIAAYVSEEEADAVVQVGLSTDIAPICNMMVKLALVELSRGTDSGISSLEGELVYDYYMWANRRERRYGNWSAMPSAGAKPTIMRWYGAHIPRNENCSLCGDHMELDEGDDIEEMLRNLA